MPYNKPTVASVHFDEFRGSLPAMSGKTVVITGTTSGTGRAAAEVLASLGARLLMLNRASERAEGALAGLTAAHPDAEICAVECDLRSFASVEGAAKKVQALSPDGLDVLCNNAGVMALQDRATGDGYDVQMQTNHLSHFLLTRELWPLLVRAAQARGEARVVQHSSVARMSPSKKLKARYLEARGGSLGGDGASMVFGGARWVRYNQTKLANCAFGAALHHRIQARGLPVKSLLAHPGLANTDLQQTSVAEGGMRSWLTSKFMRMSQSAADGAMGILSCMCLPEAQSGEFYGPGSGMIAMKGKARPFGFESFYDNEAVRELLWQKSTEAIGRPFDI